MEQKVNSESKVLINKSSPFFDKETTNIIKGIALILMFIHHFFTFPEWWMEGVNYPLIEKISIYINGPTKICVSVFCFITGYFYFFNNSKTYKYSLKKITSILISYWLVFFIFATISISFGCYKYTSIELLTECFALSFQTMYFCWYVSFYIILMLILPLIKRILSYNIHLDLLICFIAIPNFLKIINVYIDNNIVSEIITNQQMWMPCVLVGYIFANYNLFERIENINFRFIKNKKINNFLMLLLLVLSVLGRGVIYTITVKLSNIIDLEITADIIYSPLFIYTIVQLQKNTKIRILKKMLSLFGIHSLLMWFAHCAFFGSCKQIFQPILYFPQNPFFVIVWGLFLCLAASLILEKILNNIIKFKTNL